MARGTPIATAIAVEIATSRMCSATSVASSRWCVSQKRTTAVMRIPPEHRVAQLA
jgi:hypothetical protein